ncbi:unnamed protein product [Closterium sp. NIES-65]|nr:unnamed protein product [Closterium sp. NIES-65]
MFESREPIQLLQPDRSLSPRLTHLTFGISRRLDSSDPSHRHRRPHHPSHRPSLEARFHHSLSTSRVRDSLMHDEPPHQLQQPRQQRHAASLAAATAAREEEDDRMDAEEEKEEKEEEERGEEEGYREKRKERGEGVEREEKATLTQGEGVINSDPSTTIIRPSGIEYPKAGLAMADGASAGEEVVTDVLTDSFGRQHSYLRISLTERCNLRCSYCMPAEGVELTPKEHLLSTDEVIRLAAVFVSQGVTKIRLTGGEPTVRRDIVDICQSLSALPGLSTLALTSNGILLPAKLPALREAGLTHLNVSLDTLVEPRFELLTRRKGHARVLKAMDMSLDLGFKPLKLNCVVMRGVNDDEILDFLNCVVMRGVNDDEILDFVALTRDRLTHLLFLLPSLSSFPPPPPLLIQLNCVVMRGVNDDEILDFVALTRDRPINVRFIEFMPFDGNVWKTKKMVPYAEIMARIRQRHPDIARLRDHPSDTAKNFQVPGFAGSVSVISSMTSHFCSGCTRLRLLADGNLKVCLFGPNEVSYCWVEGWPLHFCSGCTHLRLLADGNLQVCLFGPNEVSLRDALRQGATEEELLSLISAAVRHHPVCFD